MIEAKLGESTKAISDSTSKAFTQATESTASSAKYARAGKGGRRPAPSGEHRGQPQEPGQDILKDPKQRGVLGEYYLETVLKNVLPPNAYQMQYPFKDGTIVDAAVITKDGIIPVDSKFSLENYNRILESSDKTERERFKMPSRTISKSASMRRQNI